MKILKEVYDNNHNKVCYKIRTASPTDFAISSYRDEDFQKYWEEQPDDMITLYFFEHGTHNLYFSVEHKGRTYEYNDLSKAIDKIKSLGFDI